MIRFPHTHRSRPLGAGEGPRRARDLRYRQSQCRSTLAGLGRVAVVGGGLAGLMAARHLAQHGIEAIVYEARPEVGGRVLSNPTFSNGRITEEGAELIGTFHTRWVALAREFGLGLINRMDSAPYKLACLDVRLRLDKDLSMPEFEALSQAMTNRVLLPLADAAKGLGDPSQPWKQRSLTVRGKPWPIAELDNLSVQTALPKFCQIAPRGQNPGDERLWKMLEFKLVNDEVAPLDQMNFLGLLCKIRGGQGPRCFEDPDSGGIHDGYWEELELFRCADGCQALATALARDIQVTSKLRPKPAKVRTLTAVTMIAMSSSGVTLGLKKTRRDGTFTDDKPALLLPGFSHVILAIPPSAWRRVKISAAGKDVDPAKGIGHVQMNGAVKYHSDLKQRFWIQEPPPLNRDRGSAPYGGSLQIGQVWEGTDNQTRVGKQGIVLSVFAGPTAGPANARRVPTRTEFDTGLKSLYRGYAGNLTKRALLSDWPNVPFINTGYWTPLPGEILRVSEKLMQPYHRRLFFAGEHTQVDFFGYMEGALRSGERAAETLMLNACGLLEKKPAREPVERPRVAAREMAEHESAFMGLDLAADEREPRWWRDTGAALADESPFSHAFEGESGAADETVADRLDDESPACGCGKP